MIGRKSVRIQPRILILFLLLAIPTLVVTHAILASAARNTYREILQAHLSELADNAQMGLVNHLEALSTQVANLSTVGAIQTLVQRSNQRRPSQVEFERLIREAESEWQAVDPERPGMVQNVLNEEASQFLRDYNRVSAYFREILVTDAFGRLAAATNKTTDYYQADENWWRVAFQEGQGGHFIGDIQYDDSAQVYGMEIAEPIRDPATATVIGVVKAIADGQAIVSLMDSARVGREGHSALVRSDGTIVFIPETTFAQGRRYEYSTEFLQATAKGDFFFAAGEGNNRVLIGLPPLSIKDRVPSLEWYVVVEEPYDEMFAPFSYINRWFLYTLVSGLLVVLALALIFSWMLSKPVVEIDPHLEKL
ncbi:MAG: cache domain-containing protein [Acidobacteria bacterium]|nr:cache domain-containing protein [Acidobacteriota bacterium]